MRLRPRAARRLNRVRPAPAAVAPPSGAARRPARPGSCRVAARQRSTAHHARAPWPGSHAASPSTAAGSATRSSGARWTASVQSRTCCAETSRVIGGPRRVPAPVARSARQPRASSAVLNRPASSLASTRSAISSGAPGTARPRRLRHLVGRGGARLEAGLSSARGRARARRRPPAPGTGGRRCVGYTPSRGRHRSRTTGPVGAEHLATAMPARAKAGRSRRTPAHRRPVIGVDQHTAASPVVAWPARAASRPRRRRSRRGQVDARMEQLPASGGDHHHRCWGSKPSTTGTAARTSSGVRAVNLARGAGLVGMVMASTLPAAPTVPRPDEPGCGRRPHRAGLCTPGGAARLSLDPPISACCAPPFGALAALPAHRLTSSLPFAPGPCHRTRLVTLNSGAQPNPCILPRDAILANVSRYVPG